MARYRSRYTQRLRALARHDLGELKMTFMANQVVKELVRDRPATREQLDALRDMNNPVEG